MSAYDYYKYKLSIPEIALAGNSTDLNSNPNSSICQIFQSECEQELISYVGVLNDHTDYCYCPEENNEENLVYYRNVSIDDPDLLTDWLLKFQGEENTTVLPDSIQSSTGETNNYVTFWNSTFSVITMIMMLLSSIFVNWEYIQRVTTKTLRINTSLKALKILIILNILLIYIPLSSTVFFLISVSLLLLVNLSSGIYQTTVFQVASVYPSKFYNYFLQGQAIGGILANSLSMICGFLTELIFRIFRNSGNGSENDCQGDSAQIKLLAFLFFGVATATVFYCQIRFNVMYKASHQKKSVCFSESNQDETPLKKVGDGNEENGEDFLVVQRQKKVSSWNIIRRSIWHLWFGGSAIFYVQNLQILD